VKEFNLFNYNDRSELTGSNRYLGTDINDTSNPVQEENRTYNYDNIGNREDATTWDPVAAVQAQISYTPNPLNQYANITTDTGTPVIESLAYDDDGNLTDYEGKVYSWNAENRLIAVEPDIPTEGDKKVEFTYDYMGRRVCIIILLTPGSCLLTPCSFMIAGIWLMSGPQTTVNKPLTTMFGVWI